MAHHQEGTGRLPTVQGILSIFRLTTRSNSNSNEDEDISADADEPPDNRSLVNTASATESVTYVKTRPLPRDRTESLLTKALMSSPDSADFDHAAMARLQIPKRGMSESSTASNVSAASTADLTSDGGLSARSNTPSPPTPSQMTRFSEVVRLETTNKSDSTVTQASRPEVRVVDATESAIEANLGRKRCISFACGRKTESKPQEKAQETKVEEKPAQAIEEPPKRKCALTFACASKPVAQPAELKPPKVNHRSLSPAPDQKRTRRSSSVHSSKKMAATRRKPPVDLEKSEATRFHEFASSNDEDDEWVNESPVYTNKITLDDCMQKENAIRKIGEAAEEEALEEEEDEDEEEEDEDHIGFSDSDDSDGSGNESDNEAGFAESDNESDAGSDYQFWTPGVTTAATSIEDIRHIRPNTSRRMSETSIESFHTRYMNRRQPSNFSSGTKHMQIPRHHKARPATPELPDSTDFVCGTLDEDRPLEDAYISCIEERRRSKHIIIPQDIDPSFPTTDPEDNNDMDDDEAAEEDDDPEEMENTYRGRGKNGKGKRTSPTMSPRRLHSPPPKPTRARHSPPPRRLFASSPKRMRSPPPTRIASPPCTRRSSVFGSPHAITITGMALAQRPEIVQAKSLPRTPNPFFVNYRERSEHVSALNSLAGSPVDGNQPQELYTRGPIDIVRGLERKRQKRKEKYWRQHCKKAAKEQQERKPPQRGRGAERMKELGLEVAERTRGYNLGKPAELVLSI